MCADRVVISPEADEQSDAFWVGISDGVLRLQRCRDCSTYRHPPQKTCPSCLGEACEWVTLSGRGSIYSYVIVSHAVIAEWRDRVPYVVVQVLPEEIPSDQVCVYNNETYNVIVGGLADGTDFDDVRVGRSVEAVFEPVAGEATLLNWRLT